MAARALDARRSRWLLLAWAVAIFALSAVTDPGTLAVLAVVAGAVFARGAGAVLRRVLVTVVPFVALLVGASWAWMRLVVGVAPDGQAYAALVLQAALLAFVTFAVMRRVDLLGALAGWPTASRLAVLTLAQVHALRLVATESWQGLQSRLPRRPGAVDAVRGAGGVTGALLTLSTRNAREVTDALRSRGF